MTTLISTLINQFGYLAVSMLIAIENIFPPIPSEVILAFSGFMVTKSELKLIHLIFASTIGALVGALILYWIGSLFKEEKISQLIDRPFFKKMGFKKNDVKKANAWFQRYGIWTTFFARFIPIVRSLISLPAGMAKVNLFKFALFTTLGSLIWNTVLLSFGNYLGQNWQQVVMVFEEYSLITLILLGLIVLAGSYFWYTKRIKK